MEQNNAPALASNVMHKHAHDETLKASTSQPGYAPGGLPSEYVLAASEHAIMTDMEEYLRSDSMKASTPSTENTCMDWNVVPDSVLAELCERQLVRYHSSDPIHQGFMPIAGFADDELIAHSGGHVEEADWNTDAEDDESFSTGAFHAFPRFPCR